MKIRVLFYIPFLAAILLGCASSKSKPTTEQIQKLETLVQGKLLKFEGEWAMPLTTNSLNQLANAGLLQPGNNASRISLIGNYNFLEVKGDSVSAQLPYYGERQMAGGYNQRNVGVEFNGLAKNFTVEKDTKTQGYQIDFTISKNTEVYDVSMKIFPNLNTYVNINSSQRLTIGYDGKILAIEATE